MREEKEKHKERHKKKKKKKTTRTPNEVRQQTSVTCGLGSAEVYNVSVEQFWQAASPFPSEDL